MVLLEPIHEQALATARRLCRSAAEGDDLYQDAVLRAFDKLPSLRDAARFRSWFYAVLLNQHRNRYRRGFWRRFLSLDARDEASPDAAEPVGERGDEWAERIQRANRMARALAKLAPEQREAVVLFEVDGFSIDEIAGMQHVSVAAVKSRLVRGRDALRRHYEHDRPRGIDATSAWRHALTGIAPVPSPKEGSDA